MKMRSGFVSNSSSSSFICDACGNEASGWDMGLEEAEMHECECEHVFCDDHIISKLTPDMMRKLISENWDRQVKTDTEFLSDQELQDYWDEEDLYNQLDVRSSCPSLMCPICQFQVASREDLARYLEKTSPVTRKEVFDGIKKDNPRRRKLYDFEYNNYVYQKLNTDEHKVLDEIKAKFGDYNSFFEFINS